VDLIKGHRARPEPGVLAPGGVCNAVRVGSGRAGRSRVRITTPNAGSDKACLLDGIETGSRSGKGGFALSRMPRPTRAAAPGGEHNEPPGLDVAAARKAATPRPEGVGDPSQVGRGQLRQSTSSTTTGRLARAPHVRLPPGTKMPPNRRRHVSRAAFQRVWIGLYAEYGLEADKLTRRPAEQPGATPH
jgi:hypothetical protein